MYIINIIFNKSMKYLAIFLILVIGLSAVTVDSKVHKSHKAHRRHLSKTKTGSEKFMQFCLGTMAAMSGQAEFIDGCLKLVPGLATVDAEEEASPDSSSKSVASSDSSTWTSILHYLGVGINVVCMFKDKIMSLFMRKKKLFMRRNRKLFLQGKKLKRFDFGAWIDEVVDDIKSGWDSFTKIIKPGFNYIVGGINFAIEKGKKLVDFVNNALKTIFKPVNELFKSIKQKFMNWLMKSPYMRKYVPMINCIIALPAAKAIVALISALTGFVPALTALSTPIGWANLLVNLICGWENLKSAIDSFKKAWADNTVLKFNYYGKALGYIIATISG